MNIRNRVSQIIDRLIANVQVLGSKQLLAEEHMDDLEAAAGKAELFLRPQQCSAFSLDDCIHFNDLSPAEAERLAMLAEECGEVVQAVTKILRHGYHSQHPVSPDGPTNREHLAREVNDVLATIQLMSCLNKDIEPSDQEELDRVLNNKLLYTHHQR